MPYAKEAFETIGETIIMKGRNISADDVQDTDILAIRSTTKVNSKLLDNSRVRFVGTATIGTDHMDIPYLEKNNIGWCYSPGCNANSVSEYVTAALLCIAQRHHFHLEGMTIGVVGVGCVGSLVAAKAKALGLTVLQNDPPRQENEPGNNQFVSIDEVLERSDIITMHTPLEAKGKHPTLHMANESFFEKMKHGTVFINAARGSIVRTNALLDAMEVGIATHTVIDTWEGEPSIRTDLMEKTDIATPHIAGYSFEGKVAGTVMVYQAVCKFLGQDAPWTPDALLPQPEVPEITIDASGKTDEEVLWKIVSRVYDIEADDNRLRKDPREFDAQRINYPIRREFRFTRVNASNASEELLNKISSLGFKISF